MTVPGASDQTYPHWALANPFRRLFAPPSREVDRLDPRPGDRVVDLGAGVGYFDEVLLARIGPGGHLTLVDINAANLQRFLRHHGPDPRIELLVQSAARLPQLADASQDRAFVANVLCDVIDKRGLLEETWRLLRSGGTAYLSFHSAAMRDPSRPLRVTPEDWKGLMGDHPWQELDSGKGRGIEWHLLRKPEGSAGPSPASS